MNQGASLEIQGEDQTSQDGGNHCDGETMCSPLLLQKTADQKECVVAKTGSRIQCMLRVEQCGRVAFLFTQTHTTHTNKCAYIHAHTYSVILHV